MPPLISEKNSDLCGSISYSVLARFASQVFVSKYEAKKLTPFATTSQVSSGGALRDFRDFSSFSLILLNQRHQLCCLVGWIIVLLSEHVPSLLYPLSAKQ